MRLQGFFIKKKVFNKDLVLLFGSLIYLQLYYNNYSLQGVLNEKETEVSLCSIISVLTFNEFCLFALILHRIKLERTITFL